MKAFIMAAGYGERLRPLTLDVPKPLLQVGGVPCICYSLACLKAAGITDIVCNLHYLHNEIRSFFAENNNFGFNITFSYEEELRGTGGGLMKVAGEFDSDFVLINSDIVTDIDLESMISHHKQMGSPGTIAVYDRGRDMATVSIHREQVRDFKNALGTGIQPVYDFMGAAVLNTEIFPYLEKGFSSVVYTGLTGLIEHKSLAWYQHQGLWEDIGTIEDYHRVDGELTRSPGLPQMVRKILQS